MIGARGLYQGRELARLEALRRVTLASIRRADITFLFTEYRRELLAEAAPWSPSSWFRPDCCHLPPAAGGRSPEDSDVLVVADLYRYKGVEDAIHALSGPTLRGLRLHVCGGMMDRTYPAELHRLAADLGLGDRVQFKGALSREQIFSEIRGALCLVQPTRLESLGLPTPRSIAV